MMRMIAKMQHLQCELAALSSWDMSPPHFPQQRQQQKQHPINGISNAKTIPTPKHTTIGNSKS